MESTATIYVAGGDTLAGSALIRRLRQLGFRNLVGTPPHEPDVSDQEEVEAFLSRCRPEYVFHAAGKSGGIQLNRTQPADLALHNLLAATHVIASAHRHGCRRLLYLGSSCCYPTDASQPMRVDALMSGGLEPTCEAYASAKLAGLKLCQAYRRQHGLGYICAIPGDLFGPGDDFSAEHSHVIPALIRKIHEAKQQRMRHITLWGTGTPRRQFLYAADLADACIFLMRNYDDEQPINIGGNTELTIAELAEIIANVVGYVGDIEFDATKPNGAARKALDSSPLRALGWTARTDFRTALEETYRWFLHHVAKEKPQRVREPV